MAKKLNTYLHISRQRSIHILIRFGKISTDKSSARA